MIKTTIQSENKIFARIEKLIPAIKSASLPRYLSGNLPEGPAKDLILVRIGLNSTVGALLTTTISLA
jgi:hypothetical protein